MCASFVLPCPWTWGIMARARPAGIWENGRWVHFEVLGKENGRGAKYSLC